jgi:hypothetical protein
VQARRQDPQWQLVHAKEVVTTGICLFARSQERIRAFEMQVLSEYARLLHGSRIANPDLSSADVALSAWSLDGVPA